MKSKPSGRRRFLKDSVALAGLAAGAGRAAGGQTRGAETPEVRPRDARAYGGRSRFETSSRSESHTPLQDQVGILTPSAVHYVVSHGYGPPDLDPRQHRLLIHGLVDRPLILSLEELKRLPSVSRVHFVECNANTRPVIGFDRLVTVQQTHGFSSCSEWTGVPLSLLLKEAGVQKEASWIVAEGAEPGKHTKSIPLTKATEDCIVAYGQNGEAVRPEQGYPLRLLVPGFEGINSVKWLRRIKLVNQPYLAMREVSRYIDLRPDGKARWFRFEMGPKSVIIRPSGGQRLPGQGFYEITGLAWSGGGAIRRVEVSTDGGRTWKDAQIQEPVHRIAFTLFRFPWNWNGEEAVLQSRSTDDLGQVQPTLAEFSRAWGVSTDFWKSADASVGHFNGILPWKVTRDGSVHNALFT